MKKWIWLSFMMTQGLAQQLPEGSDLFMIGEWWGGLNTQWTSSKKQTHFAEKSRNFYVDEIPGSLVRRKGFSIVNTTSTLNKITFMFPFNQESGTKKFLVSNGSIVLQTADFASFTLATGSLSGLTLQATQVRDKIWMTNGLDNVFTWDGNANSFLDGGGQRPNVPKALYIAYYHEKVWLFNLVGNASGLRFSAITSTDGIAQAPDARLAWPVENQLNIGQGDGQIGTGIFVYRGSLFVSKENSIYQILGDNEFNYFAKKTNSDVGFRSQDSIKILDGFVYGMAEDGIYRFDGNNSERISDLVNPDIEKINKNAQETVSEIWDSVARFGRGTMSGTTVTANVAQVSLYRGKNEGLPGDRGIDVATISAFVSGNVVVSVNASSSTFFSTASFPSVYPSNFRGYVGKIQFGANKEGGGIFNLVFNDTNTATSTTTIQYNMKSGADIDGGSDHLVRPGDLPTVSISKRADDFFVTSDILNQRRLQFAIDNGTGNALTITKPLGFGIFLFPATTGSYLSDIATFTGVTNWGLFQAQTELNNGNILFFVRSGTPLAAMTTQQFSQIVSGSVVDFSTGDIFVQWASTISGVIPHLPPVIKKVTIDTIVGDNIAEGRPFAEVWKNRYWLTVTTESSRTFPLVYVKSKITNQNPNAFSFFDNHRIRSFGKFSNNFYAGSSTAGTILKLDTDNEDAGVVIDSFWETPVVTFGSPFTEKVVSEYLFDTEQSNLVGATLKIGISVDGRSFEDTSFDISGSTRIVKPRSQINRKGKSFRFRIRENSSKTSFIFNTLGVIWQPTTIRRP